MNRSLCMSIILALSTPLMGMHQVPFKMKIQDEQWLHIKSEDFSGSTMSKVGCLYVKVAPKDDKWSTWTPLMLDRVGEIDARITKAGSFRRPKEEGPSTRFLLKRLNFELYGRGLSNKCGIESMMAIIPLAKKLMRSHEVSEKDTEYVLSASGRCALFQDRLKEEFDKAMGRVC